MQLSMSAGCALDGHLDRAVRLVPHIPAHRVLPGDAPGGVPEPDPLYMTRENDKFGRLFHKHSIVNSR